MVFDERANILQSCISEVISMFLEIWILVDRYAAIAIEHSAYEMSILMCRHILLNLSHIQIHALVVRKTI